jgi:ferredoxin
VKVTVDEHACIGAGLCVLEAEDVFDQRDDDGVVILLEPDPPEDQHDAVRAAVAVCPVLAITVEDA